MELLQFIFLLCLLLVTLAALSFKNRGFKPNAGSSSALPPSPRALPIIGHLHHLIGSPLPHHALRDLSLRHGPLMFLRLGRADHVVASSREAAAEILRTHDLSFASRPLRPRLKSFTYDFTDIAFSPYGPYWRQLRKICVMELFTPKRVASFSSIREEEISALISAISAACNRQKKARVNIRRKLQELTGDIVMRAVFNRRFPPEKKRPFLHMMEEMFALVSGFSVADLFPELGFVDAFLGVKGRIERLIRATDKTLNEIIKEREELVGRRKKKAAAMDDEVEDFLDVLLKLRDEGQFEFPVTTVNVKAIINDIFFAGTETSSGTAHWVMSELMKNPEIMKKVQEEVRHVAKGKSRLQEQDLKELSYLNQVIKETLRLHPPAPLLLPRICQENCHVQGYLVPAGTHMLLNAWALGRDPQYWEKPEKFWPERFDNISLDFKGVDFEFLPFGAGRRMCPGMNFGLANMELLLAQLIHCFDWELPDGIRPEDLDMTELFGLTAGRKEDLYLIAKPTT